MRFRSWAAPALLCFAMLHSGCGDGSGRQGSDLVVIGSGPTGQVLGGQTAVYTMTVSNAGKNPADDVKIFDSIGNQQSLMSITCSASGGAACPDALGVSMSTPTIPPGGQLVFVVTSQLTPSAKGTITNSMSASYSDEINAQNNAFTVQATAYSTSTDLVVTGVGPGGTVTGGATLDFQMTVVNNGPDAAAAVNIVNSLGNGATLTAIGCVAAGGAVCPATSVAMTTDLPAGGSLAFTVSTKVAPGINGTVANTMSANVSSDADRSNNSFTASASVVTPLAGVFVTGVGPPGTVGGGTNAIFTMTVGNSGPDAATGLSILDNVGSNLTLTGLTCTAAGGAACPATLGPVMSLDTLPVNGSLSFAVTTFVAAGTSGAITNTMAATASNDASNTQHSATAVGTASTPRATLVLGGTGPSSPVAGGGTAVFTMTVGNTGPDDATGLKVINTVGSNLTFTGASCSAAGGAVCPASVGVVSDVGVLPVGGQLTFSVNALVAPNTPNTNGAITNTVSASADNAFGGGSAVAVGQAFTARSNITVSGVGPVNVPSGSVASFAMTLGNSGPQAADSVHLVDTLGPNLTLSSISCTAAGGATCPAATGPVMDVLALPVGGSLTFNVGAVVTPGIQGSLTNTLDATVTSGVRSEVAAVAVGSAYSANVSVTGTAPSGPLAGGSSASFAMVVANSGPGTALNVDIIDIIGPGLSAAGNIVCVAGGGAVCPASPGASMVAPSIPAGGFLNFTVPVTVDAGSNGTVTNTMTATAAGDPRASDNSAVASVATSSPDLGVSQSGAAQVSAGSNAVFTALLGNPGPTTASNLSISYSLSGIAGLAPTMVCTPTLGATCPSVLGPSMSVPSLGARGSLLFTITVPLPGSARGNLLSTMSVAADGDPSTANNQASVTTAVVDPRSGTYWAVAADGREYQMAIDFDAGSYTMAGNGQSVQRSFSADGSGGWTVAGNSRLRVATDLVVGGHDFGSGVLPYVAARNFATSVGQLSSCQLGGQYNLATRNVPAAGAATTHAGTACVANNVLLVCQSDTQPVALPQNCPAGSLKSYSLSVNGTQFTGTDLGTGERYVFRAANSDALLMLLSAGPVSDGSLQMRIGVPDAPAIAGGTLSGASSTGDWVTMTLGNSSYAATGASGGSDSATLSRISAVGGPFAMRTGPLASNNQPIFVMQASPLAVMFGDFAGGASGLVQVAVP
jgi:uncharacterized repeat protein (TIGR01451 family)